MVQVTFDQLHEWLTLFFWPFVRILAFLAASPLWSQHSVPRQVSIVLGALIAFVIAPALPPMPDTPIVSIGGLGILMQEMLIGIAMGMVLRVTIAVVQAAGEFIGLQMGLAFATFFTPGVGNSMVLSRIFQMITLLMFLALNGHLMTLEILANSFQTLPVGGPRVDASAGELIARWGGEIFTSGVLMALPLIVSLLIINLTLGVLNRASPQLSIFSIGFPMTLTTGVVLLMTLMPDLLRFLEIIFSESLNTMQEVVQRLAGG
ncbi:flagellar biosynthetic protein FliR [Chromohalobacter sp. HP20-39]|uniref:flagellar biosynthetic protein FliR n=1 Tax=Chromohalobacter sp. HP20-39 TaxID=3079306 RepID=UPI00294A9D8E|nr:flagellar biosynthetic protein FliR [Chromohalobacter sp. HP20-39]MDV6319159.1 flagellar biosynthetic protein FliR [Chromohalobacter sp. HP20-39]